MMPEDCLRLIHIMSRILRSLSRSKCRQKTSSVAAYDHSCEVTIYLDRDSHGKGYGRNLYEALEKELISRGLINLYACIADPVTEDEYLTRNSEHFHSHLGYIKVGEFHKCGCKFSRWYNMIWMEKIVGEHL